jgi:hypothetical protein
MLFQLTFFWNQPSASGETNNLGGLIFGQNKSVTREDSKSWVLTEKLTGK